MVRYETVRLVSVVLVLAGLVLLLASHIKFSNLDKNDSEELKAFLKRIRKQ